MTIVPPDVCSVAVAIGEALPVALVSAVIALAVAVPVDDAPKAVAESDNVATAVPAADTVPDKRNTSLPDAPISAVTASVAALRAAVECVTAMFVFLLFDYVTYHLYYFNFSSIFTFNLDGKI
jgi:hypothetical protein